MRTALRSLLAAVAMSLSASVAFASASNTPINYQPDPALKTESMAQLRARVGEACRITQAKLLKVSEGSLSRKCGCYAGKTLQSMDAGEIQSYRDTGVFNDSTRMKALAALDSCKLERPAL